ncbi:hypothetical protein RRG08_039513 [Elysia crispata]|uniref:Uncharacterized protein n=1 Tax=Elysia crispata TaxID=231223 RepID=A0AAE1D0L5_9GAST|nr:hypothetical protein RRG08_039513 [Elysia crispata]
MQLDIGRSQSYLKIGLIRSSNYPPSDSSGMYDMNELPYISQSRTLLVIICGIMFITASCVYMPLGYIQADYEGKCFLDANLYFEFSKKASNISTYGRLEKLRLNPVNTEWGPVFKCDMTTFTAVMIAILSTVIGWSAFTVWPTMMEIGKGGGLMLVYAFMFFLCLGSTIASSVVLFNGYIKTCSNLRAKPLVTVGQSQSIRPSISCKQLNTDVVELKPDGETIIVTDVHRAIIIAEVASAALICLSSLQMCVCFGTFGVIWYHFHFLAKNLFTDDERSTEDNHQSSWR